MLLIYSRILPLDQWQQEVPVRADALVGADIPKAILRAGLAIQVKRHKENHRRHES